MTPKGVTTHRLRTTVLKESKFLKEMAIPAVEHKMYKMSLEYLAITESEEAIQDYWGIVTI